MKWAHPVHQQVAYLLWRVLPVTTWLFSPGHGVCSHNDKKGGIGHLSLVITKLSANSLSQGGIANNHKPPMLNVEAGGGLNGRLKNFAFFFIGQLMLRVKMLDRASLVNGVKGVHESSSLQKCTPQIIGSFG